MNAFAKQLKELRESSNLSQSELGKKLGFTQAGIAKWEAGTRSPSLDSLIKIAKFFKVTTDYLLGLED